MHRYFIYLSYKGTAYCGWQQQPNAVSVQEMLTKAMSVILRTDIKLVGAGRTDAGVHARNMVAHFDLETALPNTDKLSSSLNSFLPKDISIRNIREVNLEAHARFDALWRRYEYHITLTKNPFTTNLAAPIFSTLNVDAMNSAALLLFNYKDFTSFSKLHTDVKTNLCEIHHAHWEMDEQREVLVFTIQANRFLRNMVRAIVGTLLDVGTGKITQEQFAQIIEKKDRCSAGHSVPACGLYFIEAGYPDIIDSELLVL